MDSEQNSTFRISSIFEDEIELTFNENYLILSIKHSTSDGKIHYQFNPSDFVQIFWEVIPFVDKINDENIHTYKMHYVLKNKDEQITLIASNTKFAILKDGEEKLLSTIHVLKALVKLINDVGLLSTVAYSDDTYY